MDGLTMGFCGLVGLGIICVTVVAVTRLITKKRR